MNQRERRVKLERLAKLKDIHVRVMYYRCMDKSVSEIKNILELAHEQKTNEKTVWNRFTKIFEILDIKGDDKEADLVREYSPVFLEFVKSEDDWQRWGLIRAEMLRQAEELSSRSDPESSTKSTLSPESESPKSEAQGVRNEPKLTSTHPRSSPAPALQQTDGTQLEGRVRNCPPWPIIAIPLLILCVLAVFASIVGAGLIRSFVATAINRTQPAQPAIQVSASASPTIEPVAVATQVIPPSLPTLTLEPSATFTLEPTPTTTVTPYPAGYEFFDDFEDGLDPAWVEVLGQHIISNGRLTASETTVLSIGDVSWRNYQIEFDMEIPKFPCDVIRNESNSIGVRAADRNNMLLFRYTYCSTQWEYLVNGDQNTVPGTNTRWLKQEIHITIRVEGSRIEAYDGSNLLSSLVDENYQTGNIYLKILHDTNDPTFYDNFKITLLN